MRVGNRERCQPSTPASQIVLLGASNLSRSLPLVIETAQHFCGRPNRFLIAGGYGRSYGVYSRMWFRGLPGITQCGLWDALARRPLLPTFALLTDLGNDIVYEQPLKKFISWVRCCLERLAECRARTVVTSLPIRSLQQLSPRHYYFFRRLFFPGRNLTWEQAVERVWKANGILVKLCQEQGATLIEQRPEWYGIDPIHILSQRRAAAYWEILSPWQERNGSHDSPAGRLGFYHRWRLRCAAPHYRRLFGLDWHQKQPACLLADGSTVSFF